MMPSEAILRMLEADDGLSLYCGRAVKAFAGWRLSDEQSRDRLRQCLKTHAPYNFNIDWYPILQDIFVRHGVPDLVSPLTYEARQNAEYELRKEQQENPMRVVRPQDRARRKGAA